MENNFDDYLRVDQVAKKLNRHYRDILSLIKCGYLPAIKIGVTFLIHKDEVKKLSEQLSTIKKKVLVY